MTRVGSPLVVLALFVACSDLKSASDETSDGGALADAAGIGIEAGPKSAPHGDGGDGGDDDDDDTIQPGIDGGPILPPNPEAGVGPEIDCEPILLPCYANSPNILDVPDEMTLPEALSQAQSGNIIQMRSGTIEGRVLLPSGVTLHGCQGALVNGTLGFEGIGGVVEGMTVVGQIGASAGGEYTVRRTYFVTPSPGDSEVPALVMRPVAGATIKLTVAQSTFSARTNGIAASVGPGAAAAGSTLRVENCVFDGVRSPIQLSRSTSDGPLRAVVVSSTFFGFNSAITINGLTAGDGTVDISASLFVTGIDGVASDSISGVRIGYSFTHDVLAPYTHGSAPNPFVDVDPSFVDKSSLTHHDLRLARGSAAVDRVPAAVAVPAKDFYGCPRPAGGAVDPGAYESQPP